MSGSGVSPHPDEAGWRNSIRRELADLSSQNLDRHLRTISSAQGPCVRYGGKEVVLFASNNYLGLADHPKVVEAAAEGARRWGASAAASPLISGFMEPHERLAAELAAYKNKSSAILFGSGFLANMGLISSLAGEGDAVFSDALNHASIVDGCRLSRARVHVYPHGGMTVLEDALAKEKSARRRIIVTDGVFSMDGDLAPLDVLCELAERHDALLLVDEAHATGVIGPQGRGAAAKFGVSDRVGVVMGTLGKALAAYGAFAAADVEVTDYLVNRSRSLIFSTGFPPAVAEAARAALEIAAGEEGERRRVRLRALCARFREGARAIGFALPEKLEADEVPIFPLVVGAEKNALALADCLLEAGIFALAIRPPTVPPGTSRLRVTLMATHTEAQVNRALGALEEGVKKIGLF